MERIIFQKMYNSFYANGLFLKYQARFLTNHSTVYQIIDMYDNIVKALDEGKSCRMAFLRFIKSLRSCLVFKLKTYGITGNFFNY